MAMTDLLSGRELYPLSVVIATLGGDTLAGTIGSLNQGAIIPAEVLVCIPESESSCVEDLLQSNIRIIKTPCRGQVAQRAYGLQSVSQDLVLQLDDDVVLQPKALHILIQEFVRLGRGNAVAPLFYHLSTGLCMTKYDQYAAGLLQSLSAFLICGAPWGIKRMGAVSLAGIGYGVDKNYCGLNPFETQWVPGGCVLCYKEDLIIENYYPFAGKAYAEDLIHSILWKQKGVCLWVIPNASCATSVASMPFSWLSMRQVLAPHVYATRLMGGEVWRLKLWHILNVFKQFLLMAFRRT